MAVLKCKMCGGDIDISADKTFGTCENCGSVMTFPKISDEAKADAFNRGNYFRRLGEFDKAIQVYERIVQEEPGNAEAHWCCALCRFGIEYVEDPVTMEYIPTCHRASFDIFTDDIDYLAAVENADGITKKQYQKDAAKITEVQRGILATSQNEKPFDVFICYKESDESGGRTVDSTLAQDIYYQLTDAGLRVFFSRITLEDKAGSEYEPYIFAALHSAKAMVCVATKAEYLNAVWVKNEWSRFISLMKKDRSKVLLPCYRDMDPYDMPEQLSVLQSYDMSKIGFMQDLIRGIKKITAADEPKPVVKETVGVNAPAASANVAPLLKRAFMFLEDGEWAEADEYCEKVLDLDPENAEAYLGKLMAELKVRTRDSLKDVAEPFDGSNNAKKASRFDSALAEKIKADNDFILERNETARKNGIRDKAVYILTRAEQGMAFEEELKKAKSLIVSIKGFKDAEELFSKCNELLSAAPENRVYVDALKCDKEARDNNNPLYDRIQKLKTAIGLFASVNNFKNSNELKQECESLLDTLTAEYQKQLAEEKERARKAEEERQRELEEKHQRELEQQKKEKAENEARKAAEKKEEKHFKSVFIPLYVISSLIWPLSLLPLARFGFYSSNSKIATTAVLIIVSIVLSVLLLIFTKKNMDVFYRILHNRKTNPNADPRYKSDPKYTFLYFGYMYIFLTIFLGLNWKPMFGLFGTTLLNIAIFSLTYKYK